MTEHFMTDLAPSDSEAELVKGGAAPWPLVIDLSPLAKVTIDLSTLLSGVNIS